MHLLFIIICAFQLQKNVIEKVNASVLAVRYLWERLVLSVSRLRSLRIPEAETMVVKTTSLGAGLLRSSASSAFSPAK